MSEHIVWIDSIFHPISIASHLKRALTSCCSVNTVGYNELDITHGVAQPHSGTIDMSSHGPDSKHPDLYLWVEPEGGEHYPEYLNIFDCPKACYFVSNQIDLERCIVWAKRFDFVFVAQCHHLKIFRSEGINAHWLPLACALEVHHTSISKENHEISYIGDVLDGSRRATLLQKLHKHIPVHCQSDDQGTLKSFSQSKIVFNNNDYNALGTYFFEALSSGSLLLSDLARDSGQAALFRNGEEYALYRHDDELVDVARFYLQNSALREQIAVRGQRLVRNAHTWQHRVEDLLAVTLEGKPATFSAEELRERSLNAVPPIDAGFNSATCISTARRSFVIPVLDMSPASEYNISTLLHDLEDIAGDVIVVFNDQEVAEQLKRHPRVTRFAVLKQNIGVARAWNLGLEIATTPSVFILNADLHVETSSVDALERALWELPDAACVGPQGAFSDFALTRDHAYFDKGTFDVPIEVDAVSGFFFAIKLEHFNNKTVRFENAFTPCYFEELDLGLQIKRAGLKNYIIPTTAYAHEWSGTIRALREIRYYERAETAGEILLRNRQLFLNKWRGITARENNGHILESGWRRYGLELSMEFIKSNQIDRAMAILSRLNAIYPDDPETVAHFRFVTRFAEKESNHLIK